MPTRSNPALLMLAAGMALALAACTPQTTDHAPGAPAAAAPPVFHDPQTGLAIGPVAGAAVTHTVKPGFFGAVTWKLFAGPDSVGTPLVSVVLDGSDDITTAMMRIGSSDDAAAIAACLQPPAEATGPGSPATVDIDGVPFNHFSAGDAAMSHYLAADSYRAMRGSRCIAIDLVVAGTRPEVYDPPRQPPFTADEAKRRLAGVLAAVYWVR